MCFIQTIIRKFTEGAYLSTIAAPDGSHKSHFCGGNGMVCVLLGTVGCVWIMLQLERDICGSTESLFHAFIPFMICGHLDYIQLGHFINPLLNVLRLPTINLLDDIT